MIRTKANLLLLAIAAVLLFSGIAEANPGVFAEDMKHIMPLSQVRAGMKGYGLTVFKGTKIEQFDVEVLGILHKTNNGKDLILVRLSGGPITARGANIIQGMSGSPVYINGKMIGAVAYGPRNFAKEPLGMLTPIEDMLDSLDPALPSRPSGLSSEVAALESPIQTADGTISSVEIRSPSAACDAPKGRLIMSPLMTPVMVSGFSSRGISKLAEILEPFGLTPMAGLGAKADSVPVELVPGAAVGVSLVTGDIDATGTGTVTYRRGNKLVAFGHPMMGIGPIDAPMTTAYVFDVFPDYDTSFKMSSPMSIVGRVFQDRPFSIGGEVGAFPTMIPVTVDVDDSTLGRKRTFRCEVINHPLLAPRLLPQIVAEALTQVHGIPGDAMAVVDVSVDADKLGRVERQNTYFAASGIETEALRDYLTMLNILSRNRFGPLDVKSVKMNVKITPGRKTADIQRVFVDKTKYEPGETVALGVELKTYQGEAFVKTVDIKIPENASNGRLTIRVAGGGVATADAPVVISPGEDGSAKAAPLTVGTAVSVRQMFDQFLDREKNNELVARVLFSTASININGEKLENLPETFANVIKSPKTTNVKMERDEIKFVVPTDYILNGSQMMSIVVQKQQTPSVKSTAKPAPAKPASGSTTSTSSTLPSPAPLLAASEGDFNMLNAASLLPDWGSSDSFVFYADTNNAKVAAPKAETANAAKPEGGAEAKAEQKPDAKSDQKPSDQKPGEKPVGRQLGVWTQKSQSDFEPGLFGATAASDNNEVRLVHEVSKLAGLPAAYVWQVIPDDKGGAYAATGSEGIIYHVSKDGDVNPFFRTDELQALSIVRDLLGTIYVGTGPHGKVFKVDANGDGDVIFTAPEKYVVALVTDSKGGLYAAMGDGDTIYRIDPDGESVPFAVLAQPSVLSLAIDKSDNVYAGTGKGGIVYRITPEGTATPLYNAAEDAVSSLVVDHKGNAYAGIGAGKGMIYKIPAEGTPGPVFDKAPRALGLTVDSQNNVYAVSDDKVYKIAPDDTVSALDTGRNAVQFIALSIDVDGTIFLGAANSAAVFKAVPVKEGTFESTIFDAGLKANWSKVSWIAETPKGASVSLQTRTGNVATPDDSWSPWSTVCTKSAGEAITSPAARFIQYRTSLAGTLDAAPALQQVSISYLTENREPKVTITEPQPGAIVSKTAEIKWKATDPDNDALRYDLYYSADSGENWQPLGSGLKPAAKPETPAEPAQKAEEPAEAQPSLGLQIKITGSGKPDPEEILAQLKAELDRHPEIPQEVKEKMLAEAPAAIAKGIAAVTQGGQPQEAPKPAEKSVDPSEQVTTKDTSHKWDTTKVPNGSYMIKVVASDRISNAIGALTGEQVLGPIIVENRPPTVHAFKKEVAVGEDAVVTVKGYAFHEAIAITGVQFKVDDNGEWMSAAPSDGMFDSISEPFVITTLPLAKGKHTVFVKAIDAAGNSAETKLEVEVP